MRKLIAMLALMGGLALASTAHIPANESRERSVAQVTRILASPSIDESLQDPPAGSSPSVALLPTGSITARDETVHAPATSATPAIPTPDASQAPAGARQDKERRTAQAQAPIPVVVGPSATEGWQTTIIPEARLAPTPAARVTPNPAGLRPESKYDLVRAIQKELRRMGCYDGAIDGSWGGGSKRAMRTFMERVNASLPMTEPDFILLKLIESQTEARCATACPKGQGLDPEGRCLPSSILAQAARKQQTTTADASTQAEAASGTASETVSTLALRATEYDLPGRMSVGGPRPEPPRALTNPPTVTHSASAPAVPNQRPRVTVATIEEGDGTETADGPILTDVPSPEGDDLSPTLADGVRPDQYETARDARARARPAARVNGPKAASKPTRPAKQRVVNRPRGRSVQLLFTHPLGRM